MLINTKIENSLLSLLHNTNDELYVYYNPFNTMGENPVEAISEYKKNWSSEKDKAIALQDQTMWQLLVMNDSDPNVLNTQLSMQSSKLTNLLKKLIIFENKELQEGVENLEGLLLLNVDNYKGSINIACYAENPGEARKWSIHVYPNNGQPGYALQESSLNKCVSGLINYNPALKLHKI